MEPQLWEKLVELLDRYHITLLKLVTYILEQGAAPEATVAEGLLLNDLLDSTNTLMSAFWGWPYPQDWLKQKQ